MADRFILTPYYVDQPMSGLGALIGEGWEMNSPLLSEGDPQSRMSVIHRSLANLVSDAILEGDRPVSIAGDCCTSIGVLAGLQRAGTNPFLIWFDAHGDFNTWETTPSGFLGGMPLAMLVGLGEQRMPKAVGLEKLSETDVLLTDGRDLDPGERVSLERSAVLHLDNVLDLMERELPDRPLYVHFDTDVIDPVEAPAMNYLAQGGPTAEEISLVFQRIANTGRVVAVSVSSWNPALDTDGSTQAVCMGALESLLAPG